MHETNVTSNRPTNEIPSLVHDLQAYKLRNVTQLQAK